MQSTSIIRRWIRGSLLITVLVLVLAEGLFLYYSYNDLYGGVERAVENRFSTVVGRLQATGTAGTPQPPPKAAPMSCGASSSSSTRRTSLNLCCWTHRASSWRRAAAP